MNNSPIQPTAAAGQVVTFVIGEATYGVDIPCVQEIRGWTAVTRLPQAPADVLGVLNLRGTIVPILDLRLKFGSTNVQYTPVTVIIVVSVMCAKGRREFGMVVDGVSDVIDVASDDIKPAPEMGAGATYVRGLVAVAGRMVILLDVNELLGGEFPANTPDDATQAA